MTLVEYALGMGEVQASAEPAVLKCFGLGSCVGLFLFDRTHHTGGAAHIMLPESRTGIEGPTRYLYAEPACDELLRQLLALGCTPTGLRAQLVGGANVWFPRIGHVGERNLAAVRAQLRRHRIYLAAEATGGQLGRTARFDTATGELRVHTEGKGAWVK